MTHNIILISGKQGSGKTSITNNLLIQAARKELSAMNLIFAQTIYDIHDFARNTLRFRGIERPDKDGKLLQLLGTEWGRNTIDPDIWVTALLGNIRNIAPDPRPNQLFIVSDCRFKNEFDGIVSYKVRLEADREIRKARCDSWRDTDNHQSEIDLDDYVAEGKFDLVIDTNSTSAEENATRILEEYLKWKQK